jgi:hypothetical protein
MVPVPVLGQVVGTQTLADITGGKPQETPAKDAPAVTYKEMTGHTLASAAGGDEEPAATETVAVKAEPKATPAAAKPEVKAEPKAAPVAVKPVAATNTPPPAAGDAEAEAKKLLDKADNFAEADMTAKAISTYEEVMKKYPKSRAATDAEVKLLTLKK